MSSYLAVVNARNSIQPSNSLAALPASRAVKNLIAPNNPNCRPRISFNPRRELSGLRFVPSRARGGCTALMPPIRTSEDYLGIDQRHQKKPATELKLPIIIEGSPPPHDHRLNNIKVTPDPGVIEVNLHPAHNWDELVNNTTTLYEEARLTRLGAEKFMIDGRHVGTGGGNHVVIGGPTAADSPILRRPDLLASLLRFWQNHPSLSFLFSGLFIGPTSQHPRVDEARNDSLYELELACQQIPNSGNIPPVAFPG